MRYVQRDKEGKVIGHFANEQSYAKELLEDNHPDILDMKTKQPKKVTIAEEMLELKKKIKQLEDIIADRREKI